MPNTQDALKVPTKFSQPTYLHPSYSSETICQPGVSQIRRRLGMSKRVTLCNKYLNQSVFRLSYYSHIWYDWRLSRVDRERGRSRAFSCFQCKCSSSFHSSTEMMLINQAIQSIWQHSNKDSTCDPMTSQRLSNVPWQFSSPAYLRSFGAEGHALNKQSLYKWYSQELHSLDSPLGDQRALEIFKSSASGFISSLRSSLAFVLIHLSRVPSCYQIISPCYGTSLG